jgi:hypothetical protein
MLKSVTCKLGNMRKAVEWTVYPRPTNVGPEYSTVTIQSDSRICQFDTKTRKGMLSKHRSSGAYFMHLSSFLGATEVEIPQELVDQLVEEIPQPGTKIGSNVYVG